MAPFYEWGSTVSRLQRPRRGDSSLFTTKSSEFPDMLISSTFERWKAELTLELLWFWTWSHWNKNENLATRPLFHEFLRK